MGRNKTGAPVKYGRVNIAGLNIRKIRIEKFPTLSQNGLAAMIQLAGLPMTKNTVQRMEAGEGTINDIQLKVFAQVLDVPVSELLDESIYEANAYYGDSKYSDYGGLNVAGRQPDYE